MTGVGKRLDHALAAKDWISALDLLRTWATERPDDANGWFWTAYCLERLGRVDQAVEAARRACSLDPDDHRVSMLLARIEASDPDASPEVDDEVPATEAALDSGPAPTETGRGGATARVELAGTSLWRTGDVVEGRYEVRDVRRGGMGEVYFVFDRALALDLAVKTPLPKTLATASGRLRFLREAEAWIGLGLHVNICTAYYVQELGGLARLFIELIDGDGLDVWMKSKNARSLTGRLDMAIQVASGVHHAHTFEWVDEAGAHHHGLAHRDLKPANILVGSDGIAKVTDFGLVGRGFISEETAVEGSEDFQTATAPVDGIWKTVTLGGGLMGTPPYMPPEQWDGGHAAGKPADVYAFGCILFELFCGRRPFVLSEAGRRARVEAQLAAMEDMHRLSQPPQPRTLNPKIDNGLADLILQCLEKDPSTRPASFEEIRARLVDIFARVTAHSYPRRNPKARQLLGDALNNQGVSYATLGQDIRAERAWEEALANDPRHIEATFNLAIFRWQYQGSGNAETLARMEEVLRGEAPPWKARHLAGKLCLGVGDWPKALEHLRSAHHGSDRMPEVARDFAVALCTQRDSEDRDASFREAVEVLARCGGPLRSDPVLLTTYALAMQHLGQDSKAGGLYKEARRHDPKLPDDLAHGARRLIPGFNFVKRLEGFSGRVLHVAIDPTGRRAATVLHDGGVCIWDTASGEIERMLRPPGGRPRCLAISPDGAQVLTTSEGDPITTWDAGTALAQHRLQAHAGFLNALEIARDGRQAIGVGTTGKLNIWDFESRSLIRAYPIHNGFLTCLALSDDCKTAIAGGSAGKVLVVDLDDGEIISRPDRHHACVTSVAISQGGRIAISGCEDGEIRVWDILEGCMRRVLRGHRGSIRHLAVDETASTCLSADSTGTLRLWNFSSGYLQASIPVAGEVLCGAASMDWNTVLIGHGAAGLTHFDFGIVPKPLLTWAVASPVTVREAEDRAKRFATHLSGARSLLAEEDPAGAIEKISLARSIPGYGRNEEALCLAAEAGATFPRDGLNGAWAEDEFSLHQAKVNCLRTNPVGETVLTLGADRLVLLWSLTGGSILRSLEPVDAPELSAAFLPESDHCVTGGLDNVLRLWDLGDGTCIRTLEGHKAQINDLAAAGSLIVSGSSDQTARVWDAHTGVCLQVFDGHSGEILAVAFSPDSQICASSGEDQLLLWDPLTGRDILALGGHDEPPSAIAWSDDGRNLLSGARDGQLRLWDVTNGHCLRTVEVGQGVASLALSPDDRFALTGGQEGAVQIWDIRARRCLRTFDGHVGPVHSVAFTADGQRCLSAGEDCSVRLWYLDWHTAPEEGIGWNEQAMPYLEIFLSQQSAGSDGPKWGDEDFRRLLDDLARRRLGHLSPDEVLLNLERLAASWSERDPTVTTMTRATRRRGPVSATRRKKARERLVWRSIVALAFLALILVINAVISSTRLSIEPGRKAAVRRSALETRVPYSIRLGPATSCDPGSFRNYLETFIDGTEEPVVVDTAARCLAELQDSRTVVPLLDLLRPPDSPDEYGSEADLYRVPASLEDVLSILVPIGDNGRRELQEALVDADGTVRQTAARALAANGSQRAILTLVESAEDREPVVRIAVSQTLEMIVTTGVISKEQAFELFEQMAGDTFPEVRANVAEGLGIFRGSRARRLLEALAQDVDRDVARAAERTLAEFDEAR